MIATRSDSHASQACISWPWATAESPDDIINWHIPGHIHHTHSYGHMETMLYRCGGWLNSPWMVKFPSSHCNPRPQTWACCVTLYHSSGHAPNIVIFFIVLHVSFSTYYLAYHVYIVHSYLINDVINPDCGVNYW